MFQAAAFSQTDTVRGRVLLDSSGIQQGYAGVRIQIPLLGFEGMTDSDGYFVFTAPSTAGKTTIVARFPDKEVLEFYYNPPKITSPLLVRNIRTIKAVDIRIRRDKNGLNSRGLQKIEILNEEEFVKAACCTLSESFETNNTVEVSNADGVSGIRQVEMLGLAGRYVLMTRDNIPNIRGMNVLTGLENVPGPFVSGVHIAKGAGSVSNGFEGITGGLNYTLKAEPKDPSLFVNLYQNSQARTELNLISKQRLNKRNYNYTYLHLHNRFRTWDKGKDGFADMPVGGMIFLGDYFKSFGVKTEKQIGAFYSKSNRSGGDIGNFTDPATTVLRFMFDMEEERIEGFAKLGIFLNKTGSSSIGNIFSASRTTNNSTLNNLIGRTYFGKHDNVSFTSVWASDDEKILSTRTGINLVFDGVNESFTDTFNSVWNPERQEASAGIFSELVRKKEKLDWVLGFRLDYNNLYQWLFTPRFHLKYDVTKNQQFHFQAGLGRRTPWVLADNLPLFISNREVGFSPYKIIPHDIINSKWAYGFLQEKALNTGISYTWNLMMFKMPSTVSFDVFYTRFMNQVIADRDIDPGLLIITRENDNSTYIGQVDWVVRPHRRVELKLSYRYVNSQVVTSGQFRIQAMQAPHRALAVVGYETRKKWNFDLVSQLNSPKRLPLTDAFSEINQQPKYSPWYCILNMQVRKNYKIWEFYAGAENILRAMQNNQVLQVNENGRDYFDAAWAWGPTMGRNFYAGFRLKIR